VTPSIRAQNPLPEEAAEKAVEAAKKAADAVDAELFRHTVRTGVREHPEIELLLRLPRKVGENGAPERAPLGTSSLPSTANGVLVYCSFQDDPEQLREFLQNGEHSIVKWADRQEMALLTFDTATLWKKKTSTRDLGSNARSRQDHRFDRIAKVWDRGARVLCRRHGLPDEGFLLYGISRGAHYAHRLVVRHPERFDAVHLHIANSYDIPEKHADRICWLITTGHHDPGYDEAWDYYRDGLEAGHPILFRSFFGMGHEGDGRVHRIGRAFFDHVLDLRQEATAPVGREPPGLGELLRGQIDDPQWVADSINHLVYPVARATEIPAGQRIFVPTRELAAHWGRLIGEDEERAATLQLPPARKPSDP